jgi:hypothetical protein
MTADPMAPGAPAVFLYREEVTNNQSHYVSSYARIKILTEKGKEWATVEVPYFTVLSGRPFIEGRTIHRDGTVIPLIGKASDLLIFKSKVSHLNAAVFNLPSVDVGSILEYRWTVPMTGRKYLDDGKSQDVEFDSSRAGQVPFWDVQQPIFTHEEHFYFNPNGGEGGDPTNLELDAPARWMAVWVGGTLDYIDHLPAGAKVVLGARKDFTLDVFNIPAFEHEEYSPPTESLRYRVRFYITPSQVPASFWENEHDRWLKELNKFAAQSPVVTSAASQIISGTETAEAKARKLYDAVQALDNTNFSREKSEAERKELKLGNQPKNVSEIWKAKSGDRNDIAALYLSLSRAAGLDVRAMQVADRDVRQFDANYLSLQQLDSLLVVLRIDGKDIYLDPGEKLCPFGQLHWKHAESGGLEENFKGLAFTPRSLSKDAITARTADLTIDAAGTATGTVKILMNGPGALHWRQLNLTSDLDEVKKQFNEDLHNLLPQGINGEVDHFQGLDTSTTNLLVVVKVSGQLGTLTAKRLLLPGFFFSANKRDTFASSEKRTNPVDLHYTEQVIDDEVYHLPAGYSLESAPQASQAAWPEHAALLVKTTPAASSVEIKHIFARAFVLLDVKEYPALHDFYQKVATNDQQQVVLASTGSGQDN